MLARAKLNLALHVTGQRDDGYHLLDSLVAFADIGDTLSVTPAAGDQLTVEGAFAAQVPPLNENSLGSALRLVRSWGRDALARGPVELSLVKDLPVASGIGGGSADAAALIALLTEGRALSREETQDCLTLGADVPICLAGQAARVSGIGEINEPLTLPRAHLVLVNPGVPVSTPEVFRALKKKTNAPLPAWTQPKTFAGFVDWLQTTRNDLTEPAIEIAPAVASCLEALSDAPFAGMSGSGATCFALFESAEGATTLAQKTKNAHPNWWVRAGKLSTH